MKCHGPDCKVVGLKNLSLTYEMCGKCCSRVECPKHPSDSDAASMTEDGKSIGGRRDEARKADAKRAMLGAMGKAAVTLAKERGRASRAGVVPR